MATTKIMTSLKQCWEFKKCGREIKKDCPAIIKDAGYMCWIVAGTMCGEEPQGRFVKEYGNCKKCDYYAYVQRLKLF